MPKKGDEDRNLAGKFRIEGSAVFDVSPTFALPTKGEVKKAVDGIVAGKGANLKLPSGPQQKSASANTAKSAPASSASTSTTKSR